MAYVAINVMTVPGGNGAALEQRFAGRAGVVEKSPGFEHFELLRPVEGTESYLVYTRWTTREDFEAWTASQAFSQGHAGERPAGQAPAATGSVDLGLRGRAERRAQLIKEISPLCIRSWTRRRGMPTAERPGGRSASGCGPKSWWTRWSWPCPGVVCRSGWRSPAALRAPVDIVVARKIGAPGRL